MATPYLQNKRKQPGPFDDDDTSNTAPAAPTEQAAPALGTQIGSTLRSAGLNTANALGSGVNQAVNAGLRGATSAVNFVDAPVRYGAGFARDIGNALVGNPASPNAGQPLPGIVAPQLRMSDPGTAAAPSNGSFTGVTGSATTAPVPVPAPAPQLASSNPFTGVTGSAATVPNPQPSLVDQGVTINGRRLPYGAMVNGVPTFSDGSSGMPGVAGQIPRTMSDAEIKNLGNRLNTATAPLAPLASDVVGGTPSTEQMVQQRVNAAQGPMFGISPQMNTESDLASIATRDPRSVLGTAARAEQIEAGAAKTPRLRRMAEQGLAGLTQGVEQGDQLAQQGEQQMAQLRTQGQQQLADRNLAGQYQLADARLQNQRALLMREQHPVTLADGTLAMQNPITGVVTPSTLAGGQPARALVSKTDADDRRSDQIQDKLAQTATELAKQWVGAAGEEPPIGQFRKQAAQMHGLQTATNPKTGAQMVNINGSWQPL